MQTKNFKLNKDQFYCLEDILWDHISKGTKKGPEALDLLKSLIEQAIDN